MGKEKGWIKLYRDVQENWTWKEKPFSKGQAWIDLIILADYETHKNPYKGKIVEYKRGTVHLSILALSDRWGWSRGKTKRFLNVLESDNMIKINATKHRTTITLVKYEDFQDRRTTNSTTVDTTDRTSSEQQTDNKQDILKEYKNNKENKEEKKGAERTSLSSPSLDDEDDDEGYFKPDQWKEALAEWRKSNGE